MDYLYTFGVCSKLAYVISVIILGLAKHSVSLFMPSWDESRTIRA